LQPGWHLTVPAKTLKVVKGRRNKVFLGVSKSAPGGTRATILVLRNSNVVEGSQCTLAEERLSTGLTMMVVCTTATATATA
jgi:hypothetical protein